MATGLVLADRGAKMQREMGSWLSENRRTFPDTHSMASLGIIYGFMGLTNTNSKELPSYYEDYQWMDALTQRIDSPEISGDPEKLAESTRACAALADKLEKSFQ